MYTLYFVNDYLILNTRRFDPYFVYKIIVCIYIIHFFLDLFGGTSSLSARPKSSLGRRQIEREKNSLPPMRSPRQPQQQESASDVDKTSLDERLPNGI